MNNKIFKILFKGGRVDAGEINNHSQFTKLANFVGVPAISTPMGVDGNNMPVGFHLMANWVSYKHSAAKFLLAKSGLAKLGNLSKCIKPLKWKM